MENITKAVGAVFLIVIIFGGIIAYDVFAYSYVADIMWDWFAVPTFKVPNFTRHEFIAFFLIKAILLRSGSNSDIKEENKEEAWKRFANAILTPWFILAIGWIVYKFIF